MYKSHIAIGCDNCHAATWIHALAFGATSEDFPLKDHWQEMTIPRGKYMPVSSGFCLDFSGHHGGFTDDTNGKLSHVILCHDCAVAVARVLPMIFKNSVGHHSMTDYELSMSGGRSCCEFAWKFGNGDDVLIGDGRGGWIERDPNS